MNRASSEPGTDPTVSAAPDTMWVGSSVPTGVGSRGGGDAVCGGGDDEQPAASAATTRTARGMGGNRTRARLGTAGVTVKTQHVSQRGVHILASVPVTGRQRPARLDANARQDGLPSHLSEDDAQQNRGDRNPRGPAQ